MPSGVNEQFHLDTGTPVDMGLFGPDSMAWQVWSHPAAVVGSLRSFMAEMLISPIAAAAVADFGGYRDPVARLQRTMHYFLTVVFADTATVEKANLRLERMHSRIKGTTPLTGMPYSGVEPVAKLATQVLTWHSVWVAYEKLVGPASAEDEARYFQDARKAAMAVGLDQYTPEDFRRLAAEAGYPDPGDDAMIGDIQSRDDCRAFMKLTEPSWCITPQSREIIDLMVRPKMKADLRTQVTLKTYPIMGDAAVATLPRRMREMASLPTSRAWEARSILGARAAMAALTVPAARRSFENQVSPRGYALVRSALAEAKRSAA